jgi:hypothetical protein
MDLTTAVNYLSICVIIVVGIWPLNIPIMALAYKIRHGNQPLPVEQKELWLRAVLGSLGMFVFGVLMAGLNYLAIGVMGIPELPAQLALLIGFLAAGAGFLFWAFAYDEPLEGLSLALIYIFLPTLLLLLVNWIAGNFLSEYREVDKWFQKEQTSARATTTLSARVQVQFESPQTTVDG